MRAAFLAVAAFALGVLPLSAGSIDALREKIKSFPEQGHERAKAVSYSELGTALYKEGQMAEGAAAFENALQHDTSRALRRHIYLYMGKSYESSGRLDKAIPAYEEAVVYDRRNWRRHRDLGFLYEQTELYRKAIASYDTALRLNPKESSLYLSLGRAWRKLGLYQEALPYLSKALDDGFRPNATQEELSALYEGQGRFEPAAQACLKSWAADSPIEAAARLIYLAGLAGDQALIAQGFDRLAQLRAPKETVRTYENLVQLLRSPLKINDTNLQALMRSLDSEGTPR